MMQAGDKSPNRGKARVKGTKVEKRARHTERARVKARQLDDIALFNRGYEYFWSTRGGVPAYGLLDRQQQEIEEAKARKAAKAREGVA